MGRWRIRTPAAWRNISIGTCEAPYTPEDEYTISPGRFDTRDPHFALAVADADETHARIQASGLPFYDFADTPTGLRQLFIRDPAGNMIELIGPTKEPRR